jgi:hypothetical protein
MHAGRQAGIFISHFIIIVIIAMAVFGLVHHIRTGVVKIGIKIMYYYTLYSSVHFCKI